MSWSTSDTTTPVPTAAATGSSSVATNVMAIASCDVRPVRQIVMTAPVRSEPTAAKISSAARVGIATAPTIPEKTARITTIQSPDEIAPHRVRAPAVRLTAVCPTEPPTGWPWKNRSRGCRAPGR